MSILYKKIRLFKKEILLISIIWFALASIAAVAEISHHSIGNYSIYKGVFWHLLHQTNLFTEYPAEYLDTNHYGPTFSLIIAPFAILPEWMGIFLWVIVGAWFLYYAILKLPIEKQDSILVLWIVAAEMMTASHSLQFNTMLTAWMILAFILVEKERDFWASLLIAAGFLVKLYGIGAIIFFFFSRHRTRFALSFVFWMLLLFCLPMLFSSPKFVIQSYFDWYGSIVEKNAKNADIITSGGFQDFSVMGMVRRMSGQASFQILYIILPAALLIVGPLMRLKQYTSLAFRLCYLAIVLISVVIFSSSAESSTYVIAMTGVGIWFCINKGKKTSLFLLIFALILTSLSTTDFFPEYWKSHFVRAYSLKALPCFLIWIWLITDVFFRNFVAEVNRREQYV